MKKKKNKKISQSTNIQTSNRGRPPKLFVSKKPKIKREGPGRPRKDNNNTVGFTRTIPEENKSKDKIIFAMFICSLAVFGFSIYIAQNKTNEIEKRETLPIITTTGIEENTGTITGTIVVDTIQKTIPSIEEQVIQNFYEAINQQNTESVNILVDNKLKQSTMFRTYFSSKRLKRFTNNLNEAKIKFTKDDIQNTGSTIINYNIEYTLQNGSGYQEKRSATLISKEDGYKIAKLMCNTPGCSKMPFFNPGKYNIK